jgi:hypothetical protein
MAEKLDTIRLYPWDKVMTVGYVSNTFAVLDRPQDKALEAKGFSSGGARYYGTLTITTNLTGFSSTYRSNLCEAKITLVWTNGGAPRHASMTTLVAKHGLQDYVY